MNTRRHRVGTALACAFGTLGTGSGPDASAQSPGIVVTVTGSNIVPQVEGETALPVQVITREQIERANIQTAGELLSTVSANMSFGSFNESQSIAGGGFQPGFAGASLRGLSYNRTLVLLNGRRVVNYPFSANGIDLNFIPVGALDRVEVLKDGASAIYGSDAIAGVINFILRRDYRGAEVSAQYSSPEHDGGYGKRFNAALGVGDLATQGVNVFAMVDYQKRGGIRAIDRPFSASHYIPAERVDQTSPSSFPGNVITPVGLRNPTGDPAAGYANPSCLPPFSFPSLRGPLQCRFDNASVIDAVNPSERLHLVGTVNWRLSPDHELFAHALYAQNEFVFVSSPAATPNFRLPVSSPFYPHAFARFFGIDGRPLEVMFRTLELGRRTDAPQSRQWNLVAGLEGVVGGWNYGTAVAYSRSSVDDRYIDGYARPSALMPILNSGVVNPFALNTPDVVALMSATELDQTVRTGKGELMSFDIHASKEVYRLPGGPLAVAFGAEARQWKLDSVSSDVLAAGDITGIGLGIPSVSARRTVWALFGEANVPIVETLEANLAVRFDHYSDFGATTNPKLSLRWQPAKMLLVRASVGKGFQAPGLEGIYGPPSYRSTPILSDPARCPVTRSPADCNTSFTANVGGNPELDANKSTQWGLGAVWVTVTGVSLGIDYYDITLKDAITFLNSAALLQQCPDGVTGPVCRYIHRGPVDANFPHLPGPIVLIDAFLNNLGKLRTSGIDVDAQIAFPPAAWGQIKLVFKATYTLKYLMQQGDAGYVDVVDHELSPGVVPRWRHYLSLDWTRGPWSLTLTHNYQRGAYDEPPSPTNGTTQRRIGSYELWNLSTAYTGFRNWTLSAGIKNLFDRDPPLSIQTATSANGGQMGYDPSYTDPTGRLYWAAVKYAFR